MARPPKQDRSSVATDTLTLRLSPDDRAMLNRLVAHRAAELVDEGIEVTAASFVRGLIRREAKARGLLDAASGTATASENSDATSEPAPARRPLSPTQVRAALQKAIDSGQPQRQIALRAGLDASRISRFLTGKHTLTDENLAKLAVALK
jgi:transcriptional regulator with XRE-family HTH domain